MIYVNGDSWTSGWPDEETFGHREFSWPHLLSVKLGETVLNDARAGCSNYRIYRRTFDYLLTHRPGTSIVALTSWVRFEQGNVNSDKIRQTTAGDNLSSCENWNPYLAYSNFLRQIISLQITALHTNTTLYLIDTFSDNLNRTPTIEWFKSILKLTDAFDNMDDQRIAQKFKKIVDLTSHINYNAFIATDSYQSLISGCELVKGHPIKAVTS